MFTRQDDKVTVLASERQSEETLEIVHTDIVGPFKTQSVNGARYFITFIDDRSRWCEVYFLKKSGALEAFKMYQTQAERVTGKKIKYLQSDNGKEYCNAEMDNFLRNQGIQRRLSVVRTPQQNGVAERFNRTIVEMARCLLLQSSLSDMFWADAVATACHLRNRCPSRSINGDTPYQRWFNRDKMSLNYLRAFGSTVYVLDKNPAKGKLSDRSMKGIFVGYPRETKGYRIWLSESRKFIVARDVKFIEDNVTTILKNQKIEQLIINDYENENKPWVELITGFGNNNEIEAQAEIPEDLEDNEENEKSSGVQSSIHETPRRESREEAKEEKRGPGRPKLIKTECSCQNLRIYPPQKQQSVAVGKSVVLTCQGDELTSQPQWKDPKGNVINGANSGTRPEIYTEPMAGKQSQLLYISSITPAMAGNYTCVASYANMPLSASIVLDTFIAVTWTNANENQFATKGKDFKIMCEVTAEPAPSVIWFKEAAPITTGDRYVIHTNGLLIKNVQESDDGSYICRAVVIQTGELAERVIKLEVYTAPEMEEREPNVVIKDGESAAITCKARGHPPPKYSWIKASTRENLGSTSRYSVNELSGLLTINRVEAGDYGKYICSAVNEAGQNETEINVEVLVAPRIFQLQNTTANEKTEARLECKAKGRPEPAVSFRKLSNEMAFVIGPNDDGRITVETMTRKDGDQIETTGIITIQQVNRTDDGLYECLAVNEGGEARKNGHLTVYFKPSFDHMPKAPIWSWNAMPVNISCLAESIPNATIKWRFRGYELKESSHIRIFGSGPTSLVTVTPVSRDLYGFYECIATNILGEAAHTIELREAYPPGAVVQARQELITATSVTFSIVGPPEDAGPPIIAYTAQYKQNANYDWSFASNRTWSVNSPYVVENLTPLMTYDFRFAAVNRVGAGVWSAPLLVIMPKRSAPEQPKWREAYDPESLLYGKYADRYELKWKIPAHNGEPIDMYAVNFCPVVKVNGVWQNVSETQCGENIHKSYDAISYEIRGLRPDTRYEVRLQAHNVLGYSAPAVLYFQTALGVERSGFASSPMMSSGVIIGLALAGIFICFLLVDLLLFCFKRQGVIATICGKRAKKHKDDEAKLGSLYGWRFPLPYCSSKPRAPPSPAPLPPPVKLVPTPTDEKEPLKDTGDDAFKRNSSVEFDGRRVYATSGGPITGKNSAV
ncbi:Fasciclin-2 [Eumeta japonica]|uniref:Hemolin n=1 Tax=Eumeta variegata TaxID=151549 RepID=A0A4C2AE02_EUMVA|nr:Fasciclin-2 [Eumeta japonica]